MTIALRVGIISYVRRCIDFCLGHVALITIEVLLKHHDFRMIDIKILYTQQEFIDQTMFAKKLGGAWGRG